MFDPSVEDPIPLLAVPRLVRWLPKSRTGRPLNKSVLTRWVTRGVRGIRLEVLRIGGRTHTSEQRLKVFFARITDPSLPPVTPAAQKRRASQAVAALSAEGI